MNGRSTSDHAFMQSGDLTPWTIAELAERLYVAAGEIETVLSVYPGDVTTTSEVTPDWVRTGHRISAAQQVRGRLCGGDRMGAA